MVIHIEKTGDWEEKGEAVSLELNTSLRKMDAMMQEGKKNTTAGMAI